MVSLLSWVAALLSLCLCLCLSLSLSIHPVLHLYLHLGGSWNRFRWIWEDSGVDLGFLSSKLLGASSWCWCVRVSGLWVGVPIRFCWISDSFLRRFWE